MEDILTLTREQLIDICRQAVVPCDKWHDRDSYCAQMQIKSIYAGLCAGVNYKLTITSDQNTLHIDFERPTEKQLQDILKYNLEIDTIDQYRECFGYENEMFEGEGIDWYSNYFSSYMPSQKRLLECNGGDWY